MSLVTKTHDKALIRDLRGMILLEGSDQIATEVAEAAEVASFQKGETLIREGEDDHDIHFVLSGRLQVSVKNKEFAVIGPGAHVGEIALVNPNAERSATVRALEDSVTAKLSADAFAQIAERHQSLWRRMSQVLGNHLRWSNQFLDRPNACPRVLICASEIGIPFAMAMKSQAADQSKTPAWQVETHCLEEPDNLEPLQRILAEVDLGVVIIAPGDLEFPPNRDSLAGMVLIQCGMCFGVLGRERSIIVQPADLANESPATTLGLSPLTYRLDPHEALRSDIESISAQIQTAIQEFGAR